VVGAAAFPRCAKVSAKVDAVIYFRVADAQAATIQVAAERAAGLGEAPAGRRHAFQARRADARPLLEKR